MRATIMYGPGDVRVEHVPDSTIIEPTDALVVVTHAAICGSDLWPYRGYGDFRAAGNRMGHEFIGVVEAVGSEVRTLKRGDLVAAPFAVSDGTCVFCRAGLHTSCVQGHFWDEIELEGGQAEAVRVPLADGTLYRLPVSKDNALMPALLTLTDVMATGHHAAVTSRVGPGKIAAVVGDGAVGLCGVIAAKRLGAEQIILLGRRPDRLELGKAFGASDVVTERDEEAVERVRQLTNGYGAHSVLECVGTDLSMQTSLSIARPGGAIGRVGVPHNVTIPAADPTFFNNLTVSGGPAPSRAYFDELLPDVLEGRIEPGRVFDFVGSIDKVPDGYRAMDDRSAIKVMIAF
ncbi:MAG: zinc-dependent alcohol dehydrogenase family protein [Candidatus Promineofilum sp.]|nr:zinc-dependent alcohol dehydrogenase family protein [Promineifilum sp.]